MGARTQAEGFYGWWLLFFLLIVYTIPIGFAFYSPVVLYPFMTSELAWSRGEIMVGFACIMLLLGLGSPLAAWMIGRFGARLTLFAGGLIIATATLLMGLIGDIYPIYVILSALTGLGVAFASIIPVQTVIVFWFNVRRALALGLVLGGGAIGGFLVPQIITAAVQGAGGNWRLGWFMIAIASVIGAVLAILAVRNQPADMGQYQDGLPPDETKVVDGSSRAARIYRTPVSWAVRDAMRTPALWLLVVAVAGSFFLWQIVVTQAPFHLQDRGFDLTTAAFLYSLAVGLSIVGRFAIAGLGDIIEPRFLFAFGVLCILAGGALFWFVSPEAMWIAYLYPLLAGFGFGAAYVCVPAITGNYWGPEAFAGVSGLVSPIVLVFQAGAAPLAGFIYDLQGTYFTVMLIAWAGAAIGFVAMLFCKPPKPKEKPDMTASSA